MATGPGSRPALAILLLFLMLPAPTRAQSRLWRANLADSRDFLPGLDRNAPDTALIRGPDRGPEGARRFGLVSDGEWNGILHREGRARTGSRSEILSARSGHILWAMPARGSAFGFLWTERLDRNRHIEPAHLDSRLGIERGELGLAWMQGLLPGGVEGDAFVDAAVVLPDRRRQAFAWMLAGGRRGGWRLEYGMTQEAAEEDVSVLNLDTLGNRESVAGHYKVRATVHRLVVKAPAAGGMLSALATYGFDRPRRPDREFWFCDSSRHLQGRLAFGRPGLLGKADWDWNAWADFREGEAYTIGRRIPPGSEGLKRYHFAHNHSILWEAGVEAGSGLLGPFDPRSASPPWDWRLGGLHRRLYFESNPPDDALDSRRETLSYNRLGLSFIANLYGGLYKMSELIRGRVQADLSELSASGSRRLGPFTGGAGLSLYRTGFEVGAAGVSLSQRIVVVDTLDSFHRKYAGYLLGATPRLRAGVDMGFVRLEMEAAQAVPLFVEVRREGGRAGEGEASGRDPARYAPFRNGFAARAGLVAGF